MRNEKPEERGVRKNKIKIKNKMFQKRRWEYNRESRTWLRYSEFATNWTFHPHDSRGLLCKALSIMREARNWSRLLPFCLPMMCLAFYILLTTKWASRCKRAQFRILTRRRNQFSPFFSYNTDQTRD